MSILEVTDVSVRFGGLTALDGACLSADAGAITGLIGPNGAGKTTMFDALSGFVEVDSGRITVDGRDITGMAPHRRSRLGIARTFQRLELFGGLTVLENVECAAGMAHGARRRARNAQRIAEPIIRRVGLSSVAHVRAGLLPTGQARLVEVARALATLPKVLLLDEPASGQTEGETEQFARLLGDLAGDGLAVLLVEHDMDLVMHVSKKIVVLNFGRVIANGTPEEIRSNPTVVAAYLGTGAGDE